jgi:CHAT domain-containing protein
MSYLYVFVVTKNYEKWYMIPFDNADISKIKEFNASLLSSSDENVEKYRNLAYELYQKLLFFNIPDNITKLIIIPDDIISTVPFEALLTEKTGKKKDFEDYPYLIKKYTISYAFSASVLYQVSTTNYNNNDRKDILALAPVFKADNPQNFNNIDIETILGTEKEVRNIKKLFQSNNLQIDTLLNNEANEYKFKKIISTEKYKILHIATHGFVDFQNPELSALILSKDKRNIEDGILYSGEIYNLKLQADLVTLSACETARGKITKGEGVIGLSQAFVYAGAKNMIISLWKVSDLATTELMTNFYEELLNENPELKGNLKFAEALHKAKLKMIESKYAHPFFWSSFILIGQ